MVVKLNFCFVKRPKCDCAILVLAMASSSLAKLWWIQHVTGCSTVKIHHKIEQWLVPEKKYDQWLARRELVDMPWRTEHIEVGRRTDTARVRRVGAWLVVRRQPIVMETATRGGRSYAREGWQLAKALFSSQNFSRFPVTSNLAAHAWSIKYT